MNGQNKIKNIRIEAKTDWEKAIWQKFKALADLKDMPIRTFLFLTISKAIKEGNGNRLGVK